MSGGGIFTPLPHPNLCLLMLSYLPHLPLLIQHRFKGEEEAGISQYRQGGGGGTPPTTSSNSFWWNKYDLPLSVFLLQY